LVDTIEAALAGYDEQFLLAGWIITREIMASGVFHSCPRREQCQLAALSIST
jgi:hypothetical protein